MTTEALDVLTEHVAAVNATVSGGGTDGLTAGLAADCTMRFDGIPVGPFQGREAIAEAYRTSPPDDEIVVLDTVTGPGRAEAIYAWAKTPDKPAGRLLLEFDQALITGWTVEYWSD